MNIKEKFQNKKILVFDGYTSNFDAKENLKNVNETWKLDILIYNSKITVGINFDVEWYDNLYIKAANYLLCKDIFQASMRVRKIKSNNLYFFLEHQDRQFYSFDDTKFEKYLNEKDIHVNKYSSDASISPDWLKSLKIKFNKEEQLNKRYFQSMFYKFLNICGYNQIIDDIIEEEEKFEKFEKFENITIKNILFHLNENYYEKTMHFDYLIIDNIAFKQKRSKQLNYLDNHVKNFLVMKNIINFDKFTIIKDDSI